MKSNVKKNLLLSNISLKKKSFYHKKINNSILKLKSLLSEKQQHKKLSSLVHKSRVPEKQKDGFIIVYIIYFSFSATNTFLHVTDTFGNLKFRYSAGLVDFKGKQKKSRIQDITRFLRELRKLKISALKDKPIALHLNNVGSYKYFIIKNLKKNFFVRLIKSYETYSYNGCRKKKRLRKR
jgi:ribosomal protein S11